MDREKTKTEVFPQVRTQFVPGALDKSGPGSSKGQTRKVYVHVPVLEGTDLRRQTPSCGFQPCSAKICDFLRSPAPSYQGMALQKCNFLPDF